MPAERAVEGVARFEEEARRAVGIIRDGRGDREGLIGSPGRHPLVLAHPAARGLLVLVLVAPAGVGALQEVDQAFAFLRLVRVIVHADDVAERVEGDLLRVADPAGENLEAPAIRLAAEHGTLVGEEETPAFLARDITALVADGPIDAAVRAEAQPVHVVTGVGDVPAETRRDEFLELRHPVAVGVLEAPDVGDGRDVNPAVEIEDPGGDARDGGVEAFGEDGELIGDTIPVGVGQLVDALLMEGEVLPVHRTIFVVVLEAAATGLQFAGREFPLVESQFIRRRGQADVIGNPERVLADIEVADLATGRGGDVGVASLVERHRRRVGHVERPGPFHRLHLGRREERREAEQGEERAHGERLNPPRPGKVPSDRGRRAPGCVRYHPSGSGR